MAITAASLADGTLAGSKGTILTAGASKATHVSLIVFVNTNVGATTINLYLKRSGSSSRRIIDKSHSIAAGAQYIPSLPLLKLSAGDVLEGDASNAGDVDFTIYGGTEPV